MSEITRYDDDLDGLLYPHDDGDWCRYDDYSIQMNLAAQKVKEKDGEIASLKMDYRMFRQSLGIARDAEYKLTQELSEMNVALNKEIAEMRNRINQYEEDHYKLLGLS